MIRTNFFVLFLSLIFVISCGTQDPSSTAQRKPSNTSNASCPSKTLNMSLNSIYNCEGEEIDDSLVNEIETVAWVKLEANTHSQYTGLGLFGGCSATLIEPESFNESSPAYIITNGHCIIGTQMSETGSMYDEPIEKTMTFKYFNSTPVNDRVIVKANIVRYASMENTDVAIVELEEKLSSLKSQGITAFKFAKRAPQKGEKILLIGVPQAGVKSENLGLYGSSCTLGDTVSLKESKYTFNESIRYKGCSMVGGNSGSSLLSFEKKEILAVNNTTASDSDRSKSDCSLNRPCEVGIGDKVNEGYNYGQSTYAVSFCFNNEGVFDRTVDGCTL